MIEAFLCLKYNVLDGNANGNAYGNTWKRVSFLDVGGLFKVQLQPLTHEVAQLPR